MKNLYILLIVLCVLTQVSIKATAQKFDSLKIARSVTSADSSFWIAYNQCDVPKMLSFMSDDLEFYHDNGGPTYGLENFRESLHKLMCAGNGFKLRREIVPGSLRIFMMHGYGALMTGEHIFYVTEKGRSEYLDGYGKFSDLWQLKDGVWKMTRIFSYDHGPAAKMLKAR